MREFLESPNLLETIVSGAEENSQGARIVTADLTDKQLNWKPAPERWSIAQCLEHLTITSANFDKYFSAAIARQKHVVKTSPKYKPSIIGGWLARQVDPVGGRNLPAPKVFRPSAGSEIAGSLDSFLKQQAKFIAFVRQANGIDYNKIRLRSPVTPLMRYSLADAFVITVLHAQRHLAQAQRVRETPEFPRG